MLKLSYDTRFRHKGLHTKVLIITNELGLNELVLKILPVVKFSTNPL